VALHQVAEVDDRDANDRAREVVLGTLGVIYNLGDVDPGAEEGASELARRLKAATWDGSDRRVFTLPVAERPA
jgi:hypothetical protein